MSGPGTGFFVTATGTEIGKTYVTAGLIRAARRAGHDVAAMKPVLSGFSEADAATSDAGVLLAALGSPATPANVAALSPWRFRAPLSPDMAAALEGRAIDVEAVAVACRAASRPGVLTFVEGIGGVMVPLDHRRTVLDLIVALGLPVVLVSASGLGAISHCLTAVAALRERGVKPSLIVLDETPGSTVPLGATRDTLARFCDGATLAILERDAGDDAFDRLLAGLLAVVSRPA